jgi:uncharacterized protein YjbI with pentapeptide repeats
MPFAVPATPLKPIRAPELPAHLEIRAFTALDAGVIVEQCRVDGWALAASKSEGVRFDAVHLAACALDETKLTNLRWFDVLCERSTLCMVEWRGAKLTRVLVRGCRVTGAKLAEAELDDVRFVDCQVDYASFAGARLRRVAFESCKLREADFTGADLTGTAFVECDLAGADFSGAKLKGADVSTSQMSGVTVGAGDLKGLVVSREQASALAKLFGLVVKD